MLHWYNKLQIQQRISTGPLEFAIPNFHCIYYILHCGHQNNKKNPRSTQSILIGLHKKNSLVRPRTLITDQNDLYTAKWLEVQTEIRFVYQSTCFHCSHPDIRADKFRPWHYNCHLHSLRCTSHCNPCHKCWFHILLKETTNKLKKIDLWPFSMTQTLGG